MGYIETALIFILAFLIIGPKDFPKLMFFLGDNLRRLKDASHRFYAQFEEGQPMDIASLDSELLEDLRKETKKKNESSDLS